MVFKILKYTPRTTIIRFDSLARTPRHPESNKVVTTAVVEVLRVASTNLRVLSCSAIHCAVQCCKQTKAMVLYSAHKDLG